MKTWSASLYMLLAALITLSACYENSTGFPADDDDVDQDGYDNTVDCNDTDAAIHPGATEVCDNIDQDCDGTTDEETECYDDDGDGESEVAGDCDDNDPHLFSSAPEICDELDNNCDGVVDNGGVCNDDEDGDGFPSSVDCNDANALVYPGAIETCNGLDDDCDLTVDETTTCYDDDGDGQSEQAGDCNDANANIYGGATETCDGLDNDCDGTVDEDAVGCNDQDGDGYPSGPDCDDSNAAINPAAIEACNSIDDDCDGTTDEETECYDDDGDGVTEQGGDCDDTNPNSYGGASAATEICDLQDNDCDNDVDEGLNCAAVDGDGDGYTTADGDCDDTLATVNPAGIETCNGIDDNCNNNIDEGTNCYDDDGDGQTEDQGDCDDSNAAVLTGAVEVCDSADNNCNGTVDEAPADCGVDNDGDGETTTQGDCNDNDFWINSGAAEYCDGVDNDCDGTVDNDTDCFDDDGDGYIELAGDCDDSNPNIGPQATEDPSNGIDDDCDGSIDESTVSCDAPEIEPNNDWSTADFVDVPSETDSCGEIGSNGDDDYFSVVLDAFTILSLDVDAAAGGSALDSTLRLFDEDFGLFDGHDQLAYNDDGLFGTDSYITKLLPDAGTYYVRLEDFFSTGSGAHTYNLGFYVSNPCDTPETEGNDSTTSADVLNSLGGSVCGEIDGTWDDDYFRFYAAAGEVWAFDLDSSDFDSGLNGRLKLHNSTGTLLHDENPPTDIDPYFDYLIVTSGYYFIEVEGPYTSTGPYILHADYVNL